MSKDRERRAIVSILQLMIISLLSIFFSWKLVAIVAILWIITDAIIEVSLALLDEWNEHIREK